MYRPTKIKLRKRIEEPQSVFDIAKGFSQVSELASELELLRLQYQRKIDALDQTAEKTKEDIIKKLNNQFIKDALVLLDNSSIAVFAELKQKIRSGVINLENTITKAETAITHATRIQKGDKGEAGKDGVSPSMMEIVDKVLLKVRRGKDAKEIDVKMLSEKIIKQIKKELKTKTDKMEATLRNVSSKTMFGGGQGSHKIKALLGTINGSRTAFTYSGELPALNSDIVELNYQPQNPLTDYTLLASGGTVTVTYTTAPDASLAGVAHIIRFM